jgi:hypothetical protein
MYISKPNIKILYFQESYHIFNNFQNVEIITFLKIWMVDRMLDFANQMSCTSYNN